MDVVLELLKDLGMLALALLVLGVSTERGAQLVKEFLRLFSEKVPWLNLTDRRSFILAAVVSFCVTYFFGVDLSQWLPLLDGFDPALAEMVTALLTMFFANTIHDKYFRSAFG